ncbi:MAG TPA: cyclic nucleotide-binding domain-containing protein [Syntrophales bacterium]|nr:cyclic nucleotide-binding domain-containing protein [Syntrophales bacterium]
MFIREVELFQGIPSHIIDEIAKLVTQESYHIGDVIFREGEVAEFLYILEEGQIDLIITGQRLLSFPMDKTGSVFGWSSLVEPNRYTAMAECVKESKVIKIDAERLMRVFQRHPAEGLTIMRRLAGVIATRLVTSYKEVASKKE